MAIKKKIIITVSTAVFLLLLAALAAVGYFWYLPASRQQQIETEFLVNHRQKFRASRVQAVNAHTFKLYDLELGKSSRVLLTASEATLRLSSAVDKDLNSLKLEKLQMQDCRIDIDIRDQSLKINNIELSDLLKELEDMPCNRENLPLPLEISGKIFWNGQAPSSEGKIFLGFANNGSLQIRGSWNNIKHPQIKGSWNCSLDAAHKKLVISLQDCLSEQFFKQIMQYANLPSPAVNMINAGVLTGKGTVTASFPAMKIDSLQYNGRLFHPELLWYGKKIKMAKEFDFSLQGNSSCMQITVPALRLAGENNTTISNIVVKFRKELPYMIFSAKTDLVQLLANHFKNKYFLRTAESVSMSDDVSGKWDFRSGKWSISGKNSSKTSSPIALTAAGQSKIFFTPTEFDFKANGKGNNGSIKTQMRFKNLEVQCASGIFRAPQGLVYANANFTPAKHSADLEFNLASLAGDIKHGGIEIPGFAGMLSMRRINENQEVDLIVNGRGFTLVSPEIQINSGKWNSAVNMKKNGKTADWQLPAADLNIPELKISCRQKQYTVQNAVLRADAVIKLPVQLIKTSLIAKADSVRSGNIFMQAPSLRAEYDVNKPDVTQLICSLSCRQAELPENPLAVKSFINGKLDFSLASPLQLPENMKFSADSMQMQHKQFSAVLKKSLWQINSPTEKSVDCSVKFDSMQANAGKSGNGSSSQGVLHLHLTKAPAGKKVLADGSFKQVTWRYGELYFGGETMQCGLEYTPGSQENINVSMQLANANFLDKYFSANTPELTVKAISDPSAGLHGTIKFASGLIADHQNSVELRDVKFTLPFTASAQTPQKLQQGALSAKGLWILQENEGEFTADLEHIALLAPNSASMIDHTLKVNGVLKAIRFHQKPFNINLRLKLPPAPPEAYCKFELPEAELTAPLTISKYIPTAGNPVILKGNIALQGNLEYTANLPVRGNLTMQCINSDWQFNKLTASQLTAKMNFAVDEEQISSTPFQVTAGKILLAGNQTLENELLVTLRNKSTVQISNWKGKFDAGTFLQTQDFTMNTESSALPSMQFEIKDIQADKIFSRQRIKSVVCDAPLSGKIQLQFSPEYEQIFINSSDLAFKTPVGTLLQINLSKQDTIKTASGSQRDFTLAVLRSMKCYLGNFSLKTSADEITMLLKAEGVPSEPVPFVYQGRNGKTPFRNATPGEKGFDGELELNVNLKLHPAAPDVEQPERN